MHKKFIIRPSRVARGRKVKIDGKEEEFWIEFELEVTDQNDTQEALQVATSQAIEYLDSEEAKLYSKGKKIVKEAKKETVSDESEGYRIEITPEGKKLGEFKIQSSTDPQYENFVHLRFKNDDNDIYVGYLLKKEGKFFYKKDNQEKIKKIGIKRGKHFKIVPIK